MNDQNSPREIQLAYTLVGVQTNKTIEVIPEDKPVTLVLGTNQLLPEFEQALLVLKSGDPFDFVIKAENAYGPSDPYAIFDIPLNTFEVEGQLDEKMIQKGNVIPMTDDEGNKHHGEIISISKEAVTLDFNHPLAGQDLRFTGKIISSNH